MTVRNADLADVEPLTRLWRSGWRDGHAAILPPELARHRTLASFRERMEKALPGARVMGPRGAPVAFHLIKGEELNQFYVSAAARGTGVAAELMADAEALFRARGVDPAWLACAIGNDRAARFYEKAGWRRIGVEDVPTETADGPFPLKVWRYEKRLPTP